VNKKLSKLFLTWIACGWCALPLLAHGDEAATASAKALGMMEGVLHFCAAVDASAAAKLRDKITQLTLGLTEEQVAQLRQSPNYQAAYASIEEFVGKVDEHNAKKVCLEAISH
jgi:hypothetical protein